MSKRKRKKNDSWIKKEWKDRWPIIKFTLAFLVVTLVFYLITNATWFYVVRAPLLSFYSESSSILLNLFGLKTSASGDILSSPRFTVNIKEGCDAVAPAILYAVAVLSFPMKWKWKWPGIVYGLLAIYVLNVVRIISLFLAGIYAKQFFDLMHVEVWQVIFIVSTVAIWLSWLKWATQKAS